MHLTSGSSPTEVRLRTQEIECERAQEGQLLVRYYEDDDMVAREELVKRFSHLPMRSRRATRARTSRSRICFRSRTSG